MVEVKKADLKEALVIKFDGTNFGVVDLEKAKALRDVLIEYFKDPEVEEASRYVRVCILGEGPMDLVTQSYDPLTGESVFVFAE